MAAQHPVKNNRHRMAERPPFERIALLVTRRRGRSVHIRLASIKRWPKPVCILIGSPASLIGAINSALDCGQSARKTSGGAPELLGDGDRPGSRVFHAAFGNARGDGAPG